MDHSSHAMMQHDRATEDSESSDMMAMDCCDSVGHCQMAHCAMPMLTNEMASPAKLISNNVTIGFSLNLTSINASNLYRPPILI